MCGIIGYTGPRAARDVIFEGLRRLEYRGYDSAGIALNTGSRGSRLIIRKKVGKLHVLTSSKPALTEHAFSGIGHTRWATHGRVTVENAHPHLSADRRIMVVHNGIIENHEALRAELKKKGYPFRSQTDTEVIAHLIQDNIKKGLLDAARAAVKRLKGQYAIVVLQQGNDTLIAARHGSPLVIGIGEKGDENFIASDIPALLPFTRSVQFLDEEEIAEVSPESVNVFLLDGHPVKKAVQKITWDSLSAERGGYKHFMLKEIEEQPAVVGRTVSVYVKKEKIEFPEVDGISDWLEQAPPDRITMIACGTSYHAGMVAKYALERNLRIPVEADVASELRYREPVLTDRELLIAISQSGETADTLSAVRQFRSGNRKVIAICNVVGSTLTRIADGVIYTMAGPEIGVASTKAFTTQMLALLLLTLEIGLRTGRLKPAFVKQKLKAMHELPAAMSLALKKLRAPIQRIAQKNFKRRGFLFLGRGRNFPIALEGALKLKEISYIHAEGYAAGEMKHGPIALIDEELPVVSIVTDDEHHEKMVSNIQEARARNGIIIAVANPHDSKVKAIADEIIEVPRVDPFLQAVINVLPLQLLAYEIADLRGCDIDQPRNLAKSVTVE